MALAATPRLGLPGPAGTDPADVPTDLDKLRQALDPITAIYGQGLANARPAAGTPGRFYFATDLRTLYYDDGQVWQSAAQQPGDLRISAAPTGGSGWLICDGAAYPRNDPLYAPLFAVIGTAWGAGDGSSTFNVPDLRGRVPVGAGAGSGLSARALGARGGEELHALALVEIPSHAHTGATTGDSPDHAHYTSGSTGTDTPDHAHGLPIWPNNVSKAPGGEGAATISSGAVSAGANARHAHSFAAWSGGANARHTHGIYAEGGSGGHNNMQPFAVVSWFIKT